MPYNAAVKILSPSTVYNKSPSEYICCPEIVLFNDNNTFILGIKVIGVISSVYVLRVLVPV